MNNEPKKIYREKALEKVNSPEQLNSYVRTVHAGVWIILCAIIVLVAGAVIWGATLMLETETVQCAAVVKNGEVKMYFTAENRNSIKEDMILHLGDDDFILPELEISGSRLYGTTDSEIMEIIGDDGSGYVYYTEFYADVPNGIYVATVVAEEISPLELLLN